MGGGDGTSMAHCMASLLVNIAHIPKINDLRGTAALPIKRPVSNGEMTGSGEDSDAAQDPQRHRSSYAPVQTIACEVTAHHEQTPNPARKVIYHHGDSFIVEITPGTAIGGLIGCVFGASLTPNCFQVIFLRQVKLGNALICGHSATPSKDGSTTLSVTDKCRVRHAMKHQFATLPHGALPNIAQSQRFDGQSGRPFCSPCQFDG
jgi:hypothetical protein